jgi:hypothetical protein
MGASLRWRISLRVVRRPEPDRFLHRCDGGPWCRIGRVRRLEGARVMQDHRMRRGLPLIACSLDEMGQAARLNEVGAAAWYRGGAE